jgi:hypothetical protein
MRSVKALERNLKEEESFGDWLEKSNPKIAKRLMTRQMEEKKKYGNKKMPFHNVFLKVVE